MYDAKNQSAGYGNSVTDAPPATLIDRTLGAQQVIADELRSALNKAQSIKGRLFGNQAELANGPATAPKPVANGAMDEISMRHVDIRMLAEELNAILAMLDSRI